jgi:fructose/tagatose bisphosphate aldolase
VVSHGACKFSRRPTSGILAIGDRCIKKIHERIQYPSGDAQRLCVPQEGLGINREYGGETKEIYGVRKVDIGTDIRLMMTDAMRRALAKHRSVFDLMRLALSNKRPRSRGCRWKRWPSTTRTLRAVFPCVFPYLYGPTCEHKSAVA